MRPRFQPSLYGEPDDTKPRGSDSPLVAVVMLGVGVLLLYTLINRAAPARA